MTLTKWLFELRLLAVELRTFNFQFSVFNFQLKIVPIGTSDHRQVWSAKHETPVKMSVVYHKKCRRYDRVHKKCVDLHFGLKRT